MSDRWATRCDMRRRLASAQAARADARRQMEHAERDMDAADAEYDDAESALAKFDEAEATLRRVHPSLFDAWTRDDLSANRLRDEERRLVEGA